MEIVKWGNGRHTAPLERAITSGLEFCLVAWLTTQCGPHKVGRGPSHPHADASHQRQSLLFTATNNRSRRMFAWVWSTAWNSPQPSLSHNHIDLCAAEKSLSPYEDSWLQWLSDCWGGREGQHVRSLEAKGVRPSRFCVICCVGNSWLARTGRKEAMQAPADVTTCQSSCDRGWDLFAKPPLKNVLLNFYHFV